MTVEVRLLGASGPAMQMHQAKYANLGVQGKQQTQGVLSLDAALERQARIITQ